MDEGRLKTVKENVVKEAGGGPVPGEMEPPRNVPEAGVQWEYDEAVFAVVAMIPSGKVLSYGDIAELLGAGGPRQVGKVMGRGGSEVTWWRVLRSNGTMPAALQPMAEPHWAHEKTPRTETRVQMKLARWIPAEVDHARIDKVAAALPIPKRHPRMI